ncbi:MAG: response regulator [Anaerolineales bacterium]
MATSKPIIRILVVDDDLDTVKLIGTTLEKQGYTISAAQDGVEALEKVAQRHPDLILLDIMMPKMDGIEVLRRLRADPATASIPVILFTAKAQVDDKVAGLDAGADEYLTKPTHPAELVARVRSLLKRPTAMLPSLPDDPADSGKVYGVLAAKGGQGVSTLCINLGATFLGRFPDAEVVVAELRPGRGDISVYMGFTNSQGLNDLLKSPTDKINHTTVQGALSTHKSGLKLLLASNKPSDAALLTSNVQMSATLRELRSRAKYLILDLGVALPEALQSVLEICTKVILVIEPDPHTMIQTRAMLQDLNALGAAGKIIPAMVNRVRTDQAMSAAEVEKALGIKLDLVFTPAPELAYQAARTKQSMVAVDPESFNAQQTVKLVNMLSELAQKDGN